MSSWIATQPRKKLPYDALYCRTSTSGYGSNFFNFFFCSVFAKYKNKPLYLYDLRNNLSSAYHLIIDTFEPLSNVIFTMQEGITVQDLHGPELNAYMDSLPHETLATEAKRLFRFSKRTQEAVSTLKSKLPAFDLGIHVRTGDKITTGEMKAIPFERYLEEIRRFQETTHRQTLTIYLMTDSQSVLKFFQEKKEASWNFVTLPSPVLAPTGHNQQAYNKLPTDVKMKAFYHFLAEVQVLSECPHSIVTFSSNIGRLIHLLKKGTITSLDSSAYNGSLDSVLIEKK